MVVNIIYSVILPIVGCLVVAFVLIFGLRFSKDSKKELKDNGLENILVSILKEIPLWVFLVAILVFLPFVVHTIVLWDPSLSWLTKISDSIAMIVLIVYFILIGIVDSNGKFRKMWYERLLPFSRGVFIKIKNNSD